MTIFTVEDHRFQLNGTAVLPDITIFLPLKRNSRLVARYDALAWNSTIRYGDMALLCRKTKINERKYLYTFRDTCRAGDEDIGFVENSIRKESFDMEISAAEEKLRNDSLHIRPGPRRKGSI